MPVSADFLTYVLEQLSAVPELASRRMFGGVGLYSGEHFFGLIDDDVLYLRAGESNRRDFEARGARPFQPFKDKPELSMSYYEAPAEVLEDRDELAAWVRKSVAVAVAAPAGRASRRGRAAGDRRAAAGSRAPSKRAARPAPRRTK
jgi:DNA transformation protein and related proteins